jgi:hypothetical protein
MFGRSEAELNGVPMEFYAPPPNLYSYVKYMGHKPSVDANDVVRHRAGVCHRARDVPRETLTRYRPSHTEAPPPTWTDGLWTRPPTRTRPQQWSQSVAFWSMHTNHTIQHASWPFPRNELASCFLAPSAQSRISRSKDSFSTAKELSFAPLNAREACYVTSNQMYHGGRAAPAHLQALFEGRSLFFDRGAAEPLAERAHVLHDRSRT